MVSSGIIYTDPARRGLIPVLKSVLPACCRSLFWEIGGVKNMNQEQLKKLLHYCPQTGLFTRLKNAGRHKAGVVVGGKPSSTLKYVTIYVANQRFLAQKLAWLYVYGELPSTDLDHINGIKTDNRIENLRQVTRAQNMQNVRFHKHNTSGHKGVSWIERLKKWRVYLVVQYKQINIGLFANFDDAVAAYRVAAAKYHTHNPAATK